VKAIVGFGQTLISFYHRMSAVGVIGLACGFKSGVGFEVGGEWKIPKAI
jgi:hypothetical protein